MSNADSQALGPVLLVHGTFAFYEHDEPSGQCPEKTKCDAKKDKEKQRWWLRDSIFAGALKNELNGKAECNPKGQAFLPAAPWWLRAIRWLMPWFTNAPAEQPPDGVFHWSGDNSESARRAAARSLLEHLQRFNERGPFHVVAHSHAGGVLWEALCNSLPLWSVIKSFFSRNPETDAGPPGPLPNLKHWITLGTPYLFFKPDYRRLVAIIPLLALLWILFAQRHWFGDALPDWALCGQWYWFQDFWEQSPQTAGIEWGWTALSFLLGLLIFVVVVVFFVRFLAAMWRRTNADRWGYPEPLRLRERADLWSTVLAAAFTAAMIIGFLLLPDIRASTSWPWSLPAGAAFRGTLTCLWLIMSLILFWFLLATALSPVLQSLKYVIRNRRRHLAWKLFENRYYGIAVTNRDEPIVGLHAAQRGFQGEFLPRAPVPLLSDLSESRRILRRPEQEVYRVSFGGWLIHYVGLPWAIIDQWFLRQIVYNRVFAGLLDGFIWNQLYNKAFGNDVSGLRPWAVSDHPMKTGLSQPQAYCPTGADQEIRNSTQQNTLKLVDELLRKLFAVDTPVAVHVGAFFKDAMQGDAEAANSLYHTAYFISPAIQQAIAAFIKDEKPGGQPTGPPEKNGAGFAKPPAGEDVGALVFDFVAMPFQWAIQLCLLLAPAMLLYGFGYFALYEYSRDYHVAWASAPGLGTDVVTTTFDKYLLDTLSGNASPVTVTPAYDTPVVVRWWLALQFLDRKRNDEWFAEKIKDPYKRVFFYCRLGQNYAELGKEEESIHVFRLALDAIESFPDKERRRAEARVKNLWVNLASGMLIADQYLLKPPKNLVPAVAGTKQEANNALSKDYDAQVIKGSDFGYLFDKLKELKRLREEKSEEKGEKAAIDELRRFCREGKDVNAKMKRSTFLLGRVEKIGVPSERLSADFDGFVAERSPKFDLHSFKAVLAAADAAKGDRQSHLLGMAEKILNGLETNGRAGWKDTMTARVSYVKALMAAGEKIKAVSVTEQLEKQRSKLGEEKDSPDELFARGKVAVARARCGFYANAKGLSEGLDMEVRLEVAIQILMREAERREEGSATGAVSSWLRRSLDQDTWPH